jgi:hypothetical protein
VLDDDGITDVAAFGRQLRESIDWFLINGTDLVPHLELANADGALYVGRRVEHSWRALERFVDNWAEANGGYDGDWAEDAARIAAETARLPPLPDPQTLAAAWAACAHGAFQVAGDAVHMLEPRRDVVPVQMRIAREAYSLYRLAKYRWIALAFGPNELADVAYQALES